MATPLQALERMLLSQERREQSRVQETLGMMQLAQQAANQKRQLDIAEAKQDIEMFGTNLELIQKSNETMKLRSAENFLQQTGLATLYAKHESKEDGIKDFVSDLEDDFDIDPTIAGSLATATWSSYEQNNPNAIVSLGSKLHYLDQQDVIPTAYDKKLSKAFTQLGYIHQTSTATQGDFLDLNRDAINTFKTMRKTLDNEVNLSKEVSEFATGDFKIQTEFDIIDESLKKIELDKTATPVDKSFTGYQTTIPLDKSIQLLQKEAKSMNDIVKTKELELREYKNALNNFRILQRAGVETSQRDKELYSDNSASLILEELQNEINRAKKNAFAARRTETRVSDSFREETDERFGTIDMFCF